MIATTARAVLCGAALLAFSGVAPAHADDDKPFRILSLSGTGEVKAVPDTASINTGVVSDAKDAKAALARNSAAMNRLFGQLKKAGIADRDVQTSNFNIAPVYAPYDAKNPVPQHERIVGYRVSNGVTVRVRKLERLGALIDEMTVSGANRMNGIAFYVDKTENRTVPAGLSRSRDGQERRARSRAGCRRRTDAERQRVGKLGAGIAPGDEIPLMRRGGRAVRPLARSGTVLELPRMAPTEQQHGL